MNIIANEEIFYSSPYPEDVFCFSPSLTQLPSGRIIATFDLGGPGVEKMPGIRSQYGDYECGNQGKVYISDDCGKTWQHTADLPMLHVRAFYAGEKVYVIGHGSGLAIAVSEDGGIHWSEAKDIVSEGKWHQAPCAIDYCRNRVYLTMELRKPGTTWPGVMPVLMSADCSKDLTLKENWIFSEPLDFYQEQDLLPSPNGVPFFSTGFLTPNAADTRFCGDPCFLESHVLRIYDPAHEFYDPTDRTVMLWMRCHTGLTNIGAVAKGVEQSDGTLKLDFITTPGGAPLRFVNCPGGHMKFHIVYDSVSKLYWLVSSQSTDSMTKPEFLGSDRYGVPDNERHRLALYFSRNLFDWCFAGMVAIGKNQRCSRHYASMLVCKDDLLIMSRSGDENANSAHNSNLLTLHRVENFRNLIY